ncbi:hypothetical protein [Cryptosporangium arvum]|uniref:Uncharacterized protein n=1 Tax=Cryptosporangium arvum DSM 44712 TaxID=927661 RepID=A0A010ZWG0_9ACTN|nr:hypothetical protein [Cryptosporangium arvum]EXG81557.1 hypothetical protein CryarDRAFT_2673 [Cryptosporangium arvum DSM 44712]
MRLVRAVPALLGTAILLYGMLGLLGASGPSPLGRWLLVVVVGWLAVDAVLTPVVIAAGRLLRRLLPDRPGDRPGRRGAVRVLVGAAAAVSGVLTLVALPLVDGGGRDASVPSALPLDYGRGLVLLLAAGWLGVGVAVAVLLRRR